MRYKNEKIDKIIEELRSLDFDDPRCLELGKEYIKTCVEDMPIIPIMSYNVFTVCDEYYWEGFPTAENPYTNLCRTGQHQIYVPDDQVQSRPITTYPPCAALRRGLNNRQ
jgi:ABC-type transport system substrate-binding protein